MRLEFIVTKVRPCTSVESVAETQLANITCTKCSCRVYYLASSFFEVGKRAAGRAARGLWGGIGGGEGVEVELWKWGRGGGGGDTRERTRSGGGEQ
jgi:hypothetical protein